MEGNEHDVGGSVWASYRLRYSTGRGTPSLIPNATPPIAHVGDSRKTDMTAIHKIDCYTGYNTEC